LSVGKLANSFVAFTKDIKLAHSVFALPFAASAVIIGGLQMPSAQQVFWLVLAMVGARSFAMGFNRFIDRDYDRENPRTQVRGIPSGKISSGLMLGWTCAWGLLLVFASFQLNLYVGLLSLPLLAVLGFYSYWKRFSWFTHWYLGICLGLAPIAVCLALTGTVPLAVFCVGAAVALWTAGFDILYALQDVAFDRAQNLASIPARFGPRRALQISRACFAAMFLLLTAAGWLAAMGVIYFVGVGAIGVILAYEHYLVRDAQHGGKSANLNAAFFTANAYVSIVFFAISVTDSLVKL